MSAITIAIDAMGGDHGISVTVPAVIAALQNHPNLHIILVGDETALEEAIRKQGAVLNDRLRLHHTTEIVGMDEPPAQALRFKKDSSMRVAIDLVKSAEADACVSAGNTGALMATARFVLKTLPGIDRPAICALWPAANNQLVRVLDLGANVDSTPEQLFQFAVMGSVLCNSINQIEKPTIGLLNIGSEDIKGNEQVRLTAKLLETNTAINYIGFVEGDDIYKGIANIVVCDGFVGNVALKASEGLAKMMFQMIKDQFYADWLSRLAGLLAKHVMNKIRKRFDPAKYNGASLLGLRGTVIKSHGSANIFAFTNAIEQAIAEVKNNVPAQISSEVERILLSGQET